MDEAKKPSKWRGWWWKMPLAFIGTLVVISFLSGGRSGSSGSGALPNCASSEAKSSLTKVIDDSPFARSNHLKVVDVAKAAQVLDDGKGTRECSASVMLNSGDTVRVAFTLKASDDGGYFLTFEAQR